MKRQFSVDWRPATLSAALLLTLGFPFFIFIIVNSFRDSYKEPAQQSRTSGSGSFYFTPQVHKYEPTNAEVMDYFFEKNKEDARLKYLVDFYSKEPLDIQSIKGIVVDFGALVGSDLEESSDQLSAEKTPDPPPSPPLSVPVGNETDSIVLTEPSDGPPWYYNADSKGFCTLCRIAVFSAAALFGGLGAIMSLVTRAGSRVPKPIGAIQIASLALIGAVFAFLLSLVFAGGLVAGVLFPQGHPSGSNGWFTVLFLHDEFAKLLVWSFLAGFSERLVPDLFQTLTSRFATETTRGQNESEQ